MDNMGIFEVWAPENSIWTTWAKPAIFSDDHISTEGDLGLAGEDFSECKPYYHDYALIVDLHGVDTVRYGLLLAQQGFQPVPLFNATNGSNAVHDMSPIVSALGRGTKILEELRLPVDAPPAFLLDAGRMSGSASGGQFDNRWVVLPQDFPSGTLLRSRGINNVAIIKSKSRTIDSDLIPVVRPWQQAGLNIWIDSLDGTESSAPTKLESVGHFSLWRMALGATLVLSLGLRRSTVGAFGTRVPEIQETIYRGG